MAEEIKNQAAEAVEEEVNIGDVFRIRREKLAALCEAGANPFEKVKFDFDTASIGSRIGNSDICVIYTISASDMYIQPYKADGDVVKCNVLPTLPSISLQETITEGVSADSGALKISIECAHLTGDLETADGRKQALLDWISSNSAVVLVSPRDTKPGHTPIVVPCWDNITDQTDPSTGANAYELTAATPTDSVTVEYWLDISTLGG